MTSPKTTVSAIIKTRPWAFAAAMSLMLLAANLLAEPNFGDPSNLPNELATLAPLLIVAMASTPAIVSGGGGLDLSIGPLAVFCNVLLANQLLAHGIDSAWAGILILSAVGVTVGAINGVLVARFRYEPVIATLCMLFVLTGLIEKLGSTSQPTGHNWTTDLADKVGPVPGALLLICVPMIIWFALGRTSYHRALYVTGGNDATAFSAGVNIEAVRIFAYALGGLFAAFAGIALTALAQSSQASAASEYVLIGLTSVALGGTSLIGGRGGLSGSIFGAIALYLMQTLLSAFGVAPDWLLVVYGSMLMVGVLVSARVAMISPSRNQVTT